MEDILRGPVELTMSELDEIAGGFHIGIGHHVFQRNTSINQISTGDHVLHSNASVNEISSGNNNNNGSGNQVIDL